MNQGLRSRMESTLSNIPAYQKMQAMQQQMQGRQPNPQEMQQLQRLNQRIENNPRMQQFQQQWMQSQVDAMPDPVLRGALIDMPMNLIGAVRGSAPNPAFSGNNYSSVNSGFSSGGGGGGGDYLGGFGQGSTGFGGGGGSVDPGGEMDI